MVVLVVLVTTMWVREAVRQTIAVKAGEQEVSVVAIAWMGQLPHFS